MYNCAISCLVCGRKLKSKNIRPGKGLRLVRHDSPPHVTERERETQVAELLECEWDSDMWRHVRENEMPVFCEHCDTYAKEARMLKWYKIILLSIMNKITSYNCACVNEKTIKINFLVYIFCYSYSKYQNILDEALRELTTIVKQNSQNRSLEDIHIYALYSIPDSLCRIITWYIAAYGLVFVSNCELKVAGSYTYMFRW